MIDWFIFIIISALISGCIGIIPRYTNITIYNYFEKKKIKENISHEKHSKDLT